MFEVKVESVQVLNSRGKVKRTRRPRVAARIPAKLTCALQKATTLIFSERNNGPRMITGRTEER